MAQTLFDKISTAGLTKSVRDFVREEYRRPTLSKNTVILALKDERPAGKRTPLRNTIRTVAERLLVENKATTPKNGHARVEMTFEELNRPSVVQFD